MVRCMQIETELLIRTPIEEAAAYTDTLASGLGKLLRRAEQLYGPRDSSYTILGVEFCKVGPNIWYPGDCRHIVMKLTPDCMSDRVEAFFQLAHECIHLLAPSGRQNANVLEEGLAAHFACDYVRTEFEANKSASRGSYDTAKQLIHQLLQADATIIRTIRARKPALYLVTSQDILAACPGVAPELAEQLVKPFAH